MRTGTLVLLAVAGVAAVAGVLVAAGVKLPSSTSTGPTTCGDVDRFHVCVTKVERAAKVGRRTASKGGVFLFVEVEIESRKLGDDYTFGLGFDMEDASSSAYAQDLDAITASERGMCGVGTANDAQRIERGVTRACWLVFELPKGTPGIHLAARVDDARARIELGE